jgi:hypothetical protein
MPENESAQRGNEASGTTTMVGRKPPADYYA